MAIFDQAQKAPKEQGGFTPPPVESFVPEEYLDAVQRVVAAGMKLVYQGDMAEDVKAELFAACRTAGASQRQTGMTEAALRECIQNVERTRVFGSDKARQLATCHGADVKPEPVVVVVPAMRLRPARLTGCDATRCVDDRGRRYTRQGAALRRDDAAVCQAVGNKVQCH